ncbi:GGDEF domain-containing protein [Shewanella pneumatophori]|uniref:diguanylate cyclase n=1 Tax=Shewanella pneumatophori TaxID=314092 RepID=A0A9X1ZDL4_9GAMM|nr:GGDEF domain-containing protein [Shewanella pneumatophori]MCL1139718.1 diguanylate cyclase [Shewanella pneumatophori]
MRCVIVLFFLSSLVISNVSRAEDVDYDAILMKLELNISTSSMHSEELIKQLNDVWPNLTREQKTKVYMYQAVLLTYKGDYLSSNSLLVKAEKLNPSDELLNKIYQTLTTNYITLKQYSGALMLMERHLERINKINDIDIKVGSYVRLAYLALELDAYQDLREYALEAMTLSHDLDNRQHCFALLYVAVADLKQQQYQNADSSFQRSQDFCETNQLPLIALMSQKGLAEIALNTEDYQSAKGLLETVLEGYQEFNFQIEINHVNALLSQTYFHLGDFIQAETFARKVMELNDEPSHIEYKAIAAKVLSQRYLESKQYKLAYDYLESHQKYSNSILDDTKAKANAYQMAKFKHQEQAREIALLNQERRLMETQKELEQSDQVNSFMIVTILTGSIFFLSLFLFSSHRQKIRYRKLALIDRLTGVYNRGAGQDFAENEFVQVCLRDANFSVVLFDLDFFKHINDSFGHATGDWALKHVVAVIKPLIRDGDIFTRMGGEEFALFLPYSNEQAAIDIADRCKKVIEEIDSKYSGHQFKLSASFGVSSNLVDDLSLDPILKRADLALYASKHAGRNRVTVYSDDLKGMHCHKDRQSDSQKPLLS